nr:hypothetical protein [Nitrosomonas nitrosa]
MAHSTKIYRGLWLLFLTSFVVSCTPDPLQYHAERKSLIRTKRVNMFDLCNHKDREVKNFCRDELGIKRAQHLFSFIKEHVPEDYFDPDAPEDYFDSDANHPKGFTHLRPRIEVTAISEKPPSEVSSLAMASLPQSLIEQLMGQEQAKNSPLEFMKKTEESLNDIVSAKKKDDYPKTTPSLKQRLRLLINTSLNSAHIGDRLEKSYVFIFVPDGAHIETLEPLDTKKETVTLGTVTSRAEVEASLGSSIPLPVPATVSPQLSHKWERSLERVMQQQLAQRTVALNPERDVLFGSLEGLEGIDPGGNLAVSITLGLDENHLAILNVLSQRKEKIAQGETQWQVDEEPVLETRGITGIIVWYIQARIIAQSWNWVPDWFPFTGILKNYSSGARTVSEGDDIVRPQVFSSIYPATLWVNSWQLYHLVSRSGNNPDNECKYLMLKQTDGEKHRVGFKSLNDALKFKKQLKTHTRGKLKAIVPELHEIGFQYRENGPLELPRDLKIQVLFRPSSVQLPSVGQEDVCYS